MKYLLSFSALILVFSAQSAHARGGLSSGGISPPAPRAVVIQETLRAEEVSNLDVERIVRDIAANDLKNGRAVVFKQAKDGVVNGHWRMRWCVEYSNFNFFAEASGQFKEELRRFENTQVVNTNGCN